MRPPNWQQERIIANQRKAKLSACTCGAPIVLGLDDDLCAFSAAADPAFLTWAGELAAIVDRRPTYAVLGQSLFRRDRYSRSEPSDHPVLAGHRCGQPIPVPWRKPLPPVAAKETSDVAPY